MADNENLTIDKKPSVSVVEEAQENHKRKFEETLAEGESVEHLGEKKIKEEKPDKEYEKNVTEEDKKTGEKVEKKEDEFAYSKRGDFTSEVYKIIVKGLPRFFGIGEVRKHFESVIDARVCKVTPTNRDRNRKPTDSGVFVTFYDEETRTDALKKLDGYRYRGHTLKAVKANALPDPFIMKNKDRNPDPLNEDEDPEIKLKDITIPLWNIPYEKQLEMKMASIRTQIHEMVANIEKHQPSLKPWFDQQRAKFDGLPVQLEPIRACANPQGYRNKCEFSVGLHPKTKEITVGFRYGKYADGSVYIGPVNNLLHIHDRMKTVVVIFEAYLRQSDLEIFDVVTQRGHWKLLMCRYADSSDELMIKIGFDPQGFGREQLDKVRADLKEFFENTEEGKGANCSSIHLHIMPRRQKPGVKPPPVELLSGSPTISQQLFNCKFNISPNSFFQVNTRACATLYETVAELAQLDKETTLFDVCAGVGTIGLCLADRCGEVLGVESCADAVEDAKANALANNITNATYHHGLAESLTGQLLHRANFSRLVAVLDPPRAGIHHRLAATLRASPLDSLIYLACEPKSVLTGFNGLAYSQSKKFPRSPFIPVKLVPVDMFPYTRGVEWVIHLQRYESLLGDY